RHFRRVGRKRNSGHDCVGRRIEYPQSRRVKSSNVSQRVSGEAGCAWGGKSRQNKQDEFPTTEKHFLPSGIESFGHMVAESNSLLLIHATRKSTVANLRRDVCSCVNRRPNSKS